VENTFTLLTNESFELLTQTTLSGAGRFYLHFTTGVLSIDNVSSSSLVSAYKGKGNAYISLEGLQQFSKPSEITLYNVLGMKILSKTIKNASQKELLSTVGVKKGVYILKVQAENIVFTKKLAIE
ncbi:MAG: T9SS type A sorting domain-containing protein, partial [Polaribacter sp.]|nr:T9SS type A sorting domain-containing protein [Polaribacter sp.]